MTTRRAFIGTLAGGLLAAPLAAEAQAPAKVPRIGFLSARSSADNAHNLRALGVKLQIVQASNAAEIDAAFASMRSQSAGGVLVLRDGLFLAQRAQIAPVRRFPPATPPHPALSPEGRGMRNAEGRG